MTLENTLVERRYVRGACLGTLAGLVAFPVPWLIGSVMLSLRWLAEEASQIDRENDWENMIRGGWLAAYFLSSIAFATCFASYANGARESVRQHSILVAAVSCFALFAFLFFDGILDGPRSKLDPPPRFGETILDKLALTVPAILTGAAIAVSRSFATSNDVPNAP